MNRFGEAAAGLPDDKPGLQYFIRRLPAIKLFDKHMKSLKRLPLEWHPNRRVGGREEVAFIGIVETTHSDVRGYPESPLLKEFRRFEGEKIAGRAERVEIHARLQGIFIEKLGHGFPALVPGVVEASETAVEAKTGFIERVAIGFVALFGR